MKRVLLAMAVPLAMIIVSACSDGSSAEPVTIIPIGDSITERRGTPTYRCFLDDMLEEAGVEFDFVGSFTPPATGYTCPTEFDPDHEALSGATIDTRAGPALESVQLLEPEVALLMLGANDLERQQPSEIADDLASLVEDLQAASPGLTVLVAQYPPCNSASTWCQEDHAALNDAIAPFARLSTDRSTVVVVDMFTGFGLDNLHDEVHPNDAGDEELARRWMAALTAAGVIEVTTESAE